MDGLANSEPDLEDTQEGYVRREDARRCNDVYWRRRCYDCVQKGGGTLIDLAVALESQEAGMQELRSFERPSCRFDSNPWLGFSGPCVCTLKCRIGTVDVL